MCAKTCYYMRLDSLMMAHESFSHEAKDGTLRAWDVTIGNAIVMDGRPTEIFSLTEHDVTREKIDGIYNNLDWEYAKSTDITEPLLFAPFQGEILQLDGWHRVGRAVLEGIPELPMYLLTEEEAERIQWLCLPSKYAKK